MASLSEMMQYADWTGKNSGAGTAAGALEGGMGGYLAGVDKKRQMDSQHLDTILKLMEIQEKVQKVKNEDRNQKFGENMLKAKGLIPPDAGDHASAIAGAWETLDHDGNPKTVNTAQSKLAEMANNNEWRMGWSVKGGLFIKEYPKSKDTDTHKTAGAAASNAELNIQKADEKTAHEMAVRDFLKTLPPDEVAHRQRRKISPNPAEYADYVAKYLLKNPKYGMSIAHALRTGNSDIYKKMMGDLNMDPDSHQPTPEQRTLVGAAKIGQDLAATRKRLQAATSARENATGSIWDSTQPTDTSDDSEE